MVTLKRCQVVPFTHAWFRYESKNHWWTECIVCGKGAGGWQKDWYFPDRTDMPDVIPEKQPPKQWSRLPTRAVLEWSRSLGVTHAEAKACLAAGLTLPEAQAMVAAGNLDLDALAVMAGLRT